VLWSTRQPSMVLLASAMLRNQCAFKASSRNLPLNLSDIGLSRSVCRSKEAQLYSVQIRSRIQRAATGFQGRGPHDHARKAGGRPDPIQDADDTGRLINRNRYM
jgi:hypothetical protein